MSSVLLDGNDLTTFIIDTVGTHSKLVALPEWISDGSPDIDINVWNRKIDVYTYILRVSDAMKWILDQILLGHTLVEWEDGFRAFVVPVRYAWVKSIETLYEGDINFSRPWKMTIELVSEGEKRLTFYPEDMGWAYFKVKGEVWFNEEQGGYLGYDVYFPTVTGLQGAGYFRAAGCC